jgi:cardiolipin synthase
MGAALTNRRTLGAAESGLLAKVSIGAIGFAIVAALWPRMVAWPLAVLGAWVGLAWLAKAYAVRTRGRPQATTPSSGPAPPGRSGDEGA